MNLIYSLTDGRKCINIHTTEVPESVKRNVIFFKGLNVKLTYGNELLFVHSTGLFGTETGQFPPIKVGSVISWSGKLKDEMVVTLSSTDGLNVRLDFREK